MFKKILVVIILMVIAILMITDREDKSTSVTTKNIDTLKNENVIYTIDNIVVNPADTKQKFLSISFGFELAAPEFETTFAFKEAQIRDALIVILAAKTTAQLTSAKEKENIRKQIKEKLSELIGSEKLLNVYYADFVLQ